MQLQHLIAAVMIAFTIAETKAGLLRKPKIYNALITTDENLTPSRAYPVIQPVLQETGVAYSSFSSPYAQHVPALRFFNPYNNYQDSPYGDVPNEYQLRHAPPQVSAASPEQINQAAKAEKDAQSTPAPETKETVPTEKSPEASPSNIPPTGPPAERTEILMKPVERLPIPLNQYGYPPSLVPVSQYQPKYNAVNYQTDPYGFPVIYDPAYSAYHSSAYPLLPPFGAYPSAGGAIAPQPIEPERVNDEQNNRLTSNANYPDYNENYGPYSYEPQQREPQLVEPERVEAPQQQQQPLYSSYANYAIDESIKNNQNKNKDIPDVPAPPLPTSSRANKN